MNSNEIARVLRGNAYVNPHAAAMLMAADEINHLIAEINGLKDALAESQRRERAAVEDLSTYKDCGFCIHVEDQQYCYRNCQRHVDVDNFRTHPCWQWRGPQEGEPHETV